MKQSKWGLLMLLVIAGLTLAACGDSSNGGEDTGSISAQGGEEQTEAEAAGESAGQALGTSNLPAGIKVGFVQATSTSESVQRGTSGAQRASEKLGWDFQACDGKGIPGTVAACFQTFVNQNYDVILSLGNDPGLIGSQLKSAQAEGIPVFNVGSSQPPTPLFAADYAPSDQAMTRMLNDFLFEQMEERGGNKLAIQSPVAVYSLRVRLDMIRQDLKAHPEIELVADNETDFANPVASVQEATRTVMTSHPDVTAFWVSVDFDVGTVGRTVRAESSGGELPLVVGFFGSKDSLDLIRSGTVTAVVEAAVEASSWIAIDQAAELLAREQEPSESQTGDYSLEFLAPVLVTKDQNLPPAGQYVKPPADFVSFFTAKWATEFGTQEAASTNGSSSD